MGCHSSKNIQVASESQEPGEQPEGEEPSLEVSSETRDGKDASVKDGASECKS
ncbi:CHD9 neighbor protein [Erinaceus europaeus]|uniref:CHD9 neighbor protein n=1 Tax=Erinaceus europaeus TaxID=9365 RepID=A0ABM3X0V0_ERIEU|nr:CHD9 neighbor protein [Erinaceus europaeus]